MFKIYTISAAPWNLMFTVCIGLETCKITSYLVVLFTDALSLFIIRVTAVSKTVRIHACLRVKKRSCTM